MDNLVCVPVTDKYQIVICFKTFPSKSQVQCMSIRKIWSHARWLEFIGDMIKIILPTHCHVGHCSVWWRHTVRYVWSRGSALKLETMGYCHWSRAFDPWSFPLSPGGSAVYCAWKLVIDSTKLAWDGMFNTCQSAETKRSMRTHDLLTAEM